MMQGGQIAAVPGDPGRALQQVGQSMTALGAQVEEHQRQERAKLSATLAKSSYNQLRAAGEKALTDFKGVRGYNALQGSKSTMDGLRKEYERIYQGLTDEDARDAFDSAAQGFLISAQTDIDTHAQREKERFEAEESATNQQWMEQDAAKAWVEAYQAAGAPQDPQKLGPPPPPISGETYMRAALANANEQADRMGLPEGSASRNELILSAKSRVNESVVAKLLNGGDFANARKHLEESMARGEISEKAAASAMKMIQVQDQEDGDLRIGLALRDSGAPLWQQRSQLDAAFAEGKIDSRRHEAALKIIEREEKARIESRSEVVNTAVNETIKVMMETGAGPESIPIETKKLMVDAGVWDRVVQFHRTQQFPDDGEATSQVTKLKEAGALADIGPQDFERMFRSRMSPMSWAVAQAQYAAAKKNATQDQMALVNEDELTFDYAIKFGVTGVSAFSYSDRDKHQSYRDFRLKMQELWSARQRGMKQKGSIEDYRQFLAETLADREYVKDEVSSFAVDANANPAEYGEAWIPDPATGRKLNLRDIPKLERNIIIEDLMSRGRRVSWENIARQWREAGSPDSTQSAQRAMDIEKHKVEDEAQLQEIQRSPFGITGWEQAKRITGMDDDALTEAVSGRKNGDVGPAAPAPSTVSEWMSARDIIYSDTRSAFMKNTGPTAVRNTALQAILARRNEKK